MDRNPGVLPEGLLHHNVHISHAVRAAQHVQVVMESQQTLCREQLVMDCNQSSVLAECVQCWHQRVALLPSLTLDDLVRDPLIVIPPVR